MNVLKHIDELLEARGWNYATLSKESRFFNHPELVIIDVE